MEIGSLAFAEVISNSEEVIGVVAGSPTFAEVISNSEEVIGVVAGSPTFAEVISNSEEVIGVVAYFVRIIKRTSSQNSVQSTQIIIRSECDP